jgi:hypothetical protein
MGAVPECHSLNQLINGAEHGDKLLFCAGDHLGRPSRKRCIVGGTKCVVSRDAKDQQTMPAVSTLEIVARSSSHFKKVRQRLARPSSLFTRAMIVMPKESGMGTGTAAAARLSMELRSESFMEGPDYSRITVARRVGLLVSSKTRSAARSLAGLTVGIKCHV